MSTKHTPGPWIVGGPHDAGTPWTEFHGEGAPSQDDLVAFASVFYFEE